jgi:acyl-CoA thioesterase FadM
MACCLGRLRYVPVSPSLLRIEVADEGDRRHANNVQFVRWFESARIRYVESFADDLPSGMVESMRVGTLTPLL